MAYIVTLPARQMEKIHDRLRLQLRLTKVLAAQDQPVGPNIGPPMALVISEETESSADRRSRRLIWMGSVARHNTPGTVDKSITIDPLRECMEDVPIDGEDGLLALLDADLRNKFEQASLIGTARWCSGEVWQALEAGLRTKFPRLVPLIDWLLAQASPPALDSRDEADRAWQEQQDAVRSILRIADFPLPSLNAWKRPESRDAPYTAGIIPQPSESSLIDHDMRAAGRAFGLDSDWMTGSGVRCDINVLWDSSGRRRLEVTNVNALPLERRTGTDMIYYHVPTKSFTLVQYKRLDPRMREIRVDERLRSQLDRLEKVTQLNSPPTQPHEWRLGSDPCFLKLAYWPEDTSKNPVEGLAHGMYLPVSYVRILLENDCTLGPQKGGQARLLGYDRVERHLVGAQFVELVKEGLVGTVGTTREQLWSMVKRRVSEGQNVLVAEENSSESVRDRQKRNRARTSKDNSYVHKVYRQESLFGPDSEQ
ncbi:hypothetical protein ACIRBZ_42860 [Streptomyces sp. NPDC094038]|uniref:hypothetical protein n=1 Tax=Streptomyces sp. NPDC094038 TaxID=3366055 RepID=UPI0038032ECB